MSAHTNGSVHAFPHLHMQEGVISLKGGLTKRELFAAMAMQGMLSNPAICDMTSGEASQVALWANQCSDALLAELAKDGAP